MSSFGLGDLLSDEPRAVCEGCGAGVVWGLDALGLIASAFELREARMFREFAAAGWAVYICPRCRLAGVFSPLVAV